MIQALRRLNQPPSDYHIAMALAVAAVAIGWMLWAVI
jgi:hypothetical protein